MTSWLLGIIGVIFLGVLLDIMYPNGKTNAYCKSIFGIFAVAIIITPVINFSINDLSLDSDFVSEELVVSINASKANYYKLKIENDLIDNEIEGVFVEIQGNTEENVFNIENIYVDTSDIVLTKNLTNINKYEVITNLILDSIDIEKERIIIYG